VSFQPLQPAKLLTVLKESDVDFVLIGAMAVTAWSSEIRGNGDVDIMVPVGDEANKARLNKALKKLRAAQLPLEQGGINTTDAEHPTLMFQTRFGKLDILYRPDGSAPYCEIKARAPVRTVAGHAIHVASRDDMVRMKAAGGRERDLDDLALLTEVDKGDPVKVELTMPLRPGVDADEAKDFTFSRVEMFDEDAQVWVTEDGQWLKASAARAAMSAEQVKQWANYLADRLRGRDFLGEGEIEVEVTEP
jgi:hypothetical protein